MTIPRRSIFLTHDVELTNISLQTHIEVLAEIDETTDPEVYALTEAAILECEELLSSSKFYDC